MPRSFGEIVQDAGFRASGGGLFMDCAIGLRVNSQFIDNPMLVVLLWESRAYGLRASDVANIGEDTD